MINMDNVPNQQISGLSSDELEWVSEESGSRYITELSDEFLNYLNGEEEELTVNEISEEIQKEMDALEMEGTPQSTIRQTNDNINRLKSFLNEKELSSDLENIPIRLLNDYLRYFYSQLRSKDNRYYAPASLICIRAALHRHFLMIRTDINIIGDIRFAKSNKMLVSMIRKYKKSNQSSRRDVFPVIEKHDMKTIMKHFDRSDGEILQNEIMFQIIYHFGLRGRETLPHLTKSSFGIVTDSEHRKFVRINHELLTKNAKASLKQNEREDTKKARMYECPNEKGNCPVTAFEMYIDKIKDTTDDHLFPKPCKNISKGLSDQKWYTNKQKVGKNKIDNLMSNLSMHLKLSKRYTNHSLRVTHITVLKENGFTNCEIAANTGHKNPESIERYNRKRRDDDFASMSAALTCETSDNSVVIKRVGSQGKVTIKEKVENNESQQNVIVNFHFSGNFQNCHFHCGK